MIINAPHNEDEELDLPAPPLGPNFITAVIDRLENKQAVLKTETGQEIIWPIDKLNECREGETVQLILQTEQDQTAARQQIAKDFLNHILNRQSAKTNEQNKNN